MVIAKLAKQKMKTTLSLLLCLFSLALKAQTIKGKIIDAKTTQGIPIVNITLTDQSTPKQIKYFSSDSLGNFEFNNLKVARYQLTLNLMGYLKVQKELDLTDNRIIDLGNIPLTEDANLLQAVTITGGTPSFETKNGQLKIGVANNTFFKSSANLMDVLRKVPGLQVNPDGTMLLSNRSSPTVFVDGRPTNMNADEIQSYLNSLSPDMVESIELINQPSAKYDGQYQGIIDVKLKRSYSLGLKGTYNLRFQQNNNNMLDNNLALNYKAAKFLYSLNVGHTIGSTYYKYYALQLLPNTNAMTTETKTIAANNNYNIQARLAFEPKQGQQLEAFFRTYQIDRNSVINNQLTTQNNNFNQTLAILQSHNNALPKQHNYAGGINYDVKFKKSELHILTTLAQIDNLQREDIQNSNQMNGQLVNYWKTNSSNNITIRTAQADYTQELGTAKLEFGTKYAYTSTANKLRYDTLGNGSFNPDPMRSNQFNYHEYIAAAYVSYLKKIGNFNYSLSLRTEYTNTLANSITEYTTTERKYFKWLPSINLTYEIAKDQQLSLGYSRRLTRPTFEALNPFRFYYSQRHYWIGNPYLQPSTTDLFSFSYSKKALNIAFNAGREHNQMVRYPEYNPTTNILAFMGTNLPYRDFANVVASLPITINKWWRMNHSFGVFYNRENRPYFGQTYKIPVFDYNLSGSQVFNIKQWLVDVSFYYQSKSGSGLYIYMPFSTVDIGIQRSLLKNKLNAKLNLQDIFYNGKRRLIFREKAIINNDFYHDNGTRRLVFSLTYNFGSSTYKAKETKRSEEEGRVN